MCVMVDHSRVARLLLLQLTFIDHLRDLFWAGLVPALVVDLDGTYISICLFSKPRIKEHGFINANIFMGKLAI